MLLQGLYAIADQAVLAARGVELRTFAEQLRSAEVDVVQWRCKDGSPREILDGATVLRQVLGGSACRLIMNDRADLAALAGFDGVHLGQGDLSVADARRLLPRGIIGISTHNGVEVTRADAGGADYVAIGPVFATTSKLDAEAAVGLDGVRQARALTGKPLVAIGGITLGSAASVVRAGANAVAVISGLMAAGEGTAELARRYKLVLGV